MAGRRVRNDNSNIFVAVSTELFYSHVAPVDNKKIKFLTGKDKTIILNIKWIKKI